MHYGRWLQPPQNASHRTAWPLSNLAAKQRFFRLLGSLERRMTQRSAAASISVRAMSSPGRLARCKALATIKV